MGKVVGVKYNMRTPEEKEKIIKEFYESKVGAIAFCTEHEIGISTFKEWRKKYSKYGIEGLKSKTGKFTRAEKANNKGIYLRKPKTREEALEIEIIKLQIENERLKKGYTVKGDGAKKEYVSTLEKNTK